MRGHIIATMRGVVRIHGRFLLKKNSLALLALGITVTCAVTAAEEERPPAGYVLEKALAGPLAEVHEIIFVTRASYDDPHWYANIGYYCDDETRKARAGDGAPDVGKLYGLDIRTGETRILLDGAGGSVRDPQVHYDGEKILFSYRKADSDYYHLHEINTDGSGLRQLTFGPYDDFEPTYLPDGDIIFVSTRCKRWVNCWMTQVATMFRSDGDGKDIRQVSGNTEHDNTPWVMPDGRILYTRWEYVDRSQVDFHHLWTMNPDGSNQAIYYGNMHPGILMIDGKPIPGTDKVAASFSPGHGINEHRGPLGIVHAKLGPDNPAAVHYPRPGLHIQDPYPVAEDCILMAQNSRIIVMDSAGNKDVLHEHKYEGGIHEPRPVMSRERERVIPSRADKSRSAGELVLTDVYMGRNMEGVQRGDIKKLLVLELLPKPVNFSGGPDLLTWLGTFTLQRVVGTVPVEADGSAYFEIPPNRSFFFVALDENDMSVKRMQSFVSVVPGERLSCSGCHEPRAGTPVNPGRDVVLATRRPPSKIKPFEGIPDVIDFHRDVQPVLDRNCVKCHNFSKREGHVSLVGDLGPMYSHSYYALYAKLQIADGRNGLGNQPPRSLGSSASALMNKIDGSHHGVELSEQDWRTIWMWVESSATYVGTYAALRNAKDQGQVPAWRVFGSQQEVLKRRCSGCHPGDAQTGTGMPLPFSPDNEARRKAVNRPTVNHERFVVPNDPLARFGIHVLVNLSVPAMSLLLQAPLAPEAGGLGSCGSVFVDKEDPDYKSMLAAIEACKTSADAKPRYATPGFRPNRQYIREMKAYGILPATFNADADPIDSFETDQAYWESLWHRPSHKLPWGPESPEENVGGLASSALPTAQE